MSFSIAGMGRALPSRCLNNLLLAAEHNIDGRPLMRAPGVETRFHVGKESQVDLACSAAQSALGEAGLSISDIDLVISACAVPYQPIPGLAPLIGKRLGAGDGSFEAMDINTTCLSFLSAFDTAANLMWAGRHDHILIVSSEVASRGLPWHDDPETAALFGDGAAAMVLRPGSDRIAAQAFECHPSGYEHCQILSGGTRFDLRKDREAFEAGAFFRMNGKALFKSTTQVLPRMVDELLDDAGWTRDDIDLVVPHQASPLGIAHMTRSCRFAPERVVDIVRSHGNMIAASLPFALSLARAEGRIPERGRILMLGTSAGVNFGGLAIEIEG